MTDRPTLSDLRRRVYKHSGTTRTETGTWLARRVGRPSAIYGTWAATRIGISAHVVTILALIANLGGALLIGTGARWAFVSGVVCLALAYWLDHVDGQVARWKGTASLSGVYFDYLMHHTASMTLGFALGFGLTMRGGSPLWSIAGFAIAFGWLGLSIHNDCKYKAFFQRLKNATTDFCVAPPGASGAGSSRAKARPASWLAAKACESHIVLIGLAGLSVLAIVATEQWLLAWRAGVIAMAIVAPALAILRAGKAIHRGAIDREFAEWFRAGIDRPDPFQQP